MRWAWALVVATACGGIAIDEGSGDDDGPMPTRAELCAAACGPVSQCRTDEDRCQPECEVRFERCPDEREQYLACLGATPTCDAPAACRARQEALLTCLGMEIGDATCFAMDDGCSCTHFDGAGNRYEYVCEGGPTATCSCSVNFTSVGECEDDPAAGCGYVEGCCTHLLLVQGLP
ncbi:MAG: hypothetical protein KC731_30660 [Myxococcales bacterium]|nr:hypothetical protein [Myxococcales bacterium]